MSRCCHRLIVALLALYAPFMVQAASIDIVAIVNDTVITTTDLNERRSLALALNGVEPTPENLERATPRVVQSLIEEALQLEEAKRFSISVSDEEVAKAIITNEQAKGQPEGATEAFIARNGLSKRSLDAQVRASLAWTRVVQRRLRRNVSVSDDEIARAQQTEAASPGVAEVRIAAIALPIRSAQDEARVMALTESMTQEIASGASLGNVALKYSKEDIDIAPPRWVAEESLPAPLQQTLRTLEMQQVSKPIRTAENVQMLQLLERRMTKPLPDATEVVLKEITIPAPGTPSKDAMENFRQQTLVVRGNPGTCLESGVGVENTSAQTNFIRTQLGGLPPPLRSIINHLAVGDISEPLVSPRAIKLVMLCEKIEPATTALADADKIRQQLFAEKLELEAAKRLRDLKREAFIEIKGANAR